MDRLDAMAAFVLAVERGSLAAAARELRRSPPAITRAIVALEDHVGSQLLRRTTRSLALTEAGEHYIAVCRRVLADLDEADRVAGGQHTIPRGRLAITAPIAFGHLHVQPVVDAFLAAYPEVQVELALLDRVVHIIDEGFDVAVRIAALPDSSLIALRIGEVTRILCASPAYLRRCPPLAAPPDLVAHACIASPPEGRGPWTFGRTSVRVPIRLAVNTASAAIASALAGNGIACVLSYQVETELRTAKLVRVLAEHEPPPVPVHLVYGGTPPVAAKTRAFSSFALPRLRAALAG
jgi:DNA-binding transcriptional LysR family regulator